jgi:hypothetical protein
MTATAIGMENSQAVAVFLRGQRPGVIAMMAMLVMAEMSGRHPGRLVPAICGGRAPGELELHHEQQGDEKPTSHGADSK